MNGRGQACVTTISNGCDENKVVDVPLPNDSKIISFSAGPNYILFINERNQLWGTKNALSFEEEYEHETNPHYFFEYTSSKPWGTKRLVHVQCEQGYTYLVAEDHSLYSFGVNTDGQLADGTRLKSNVFKKAKFYADYENVTVKQIAAGGEFVVFCTLDGRLFVVGSNYFGQLGLDDPNEKLITEFWHRTIPEKVVQVACGFVHVLALTDKGTVYGSGYNEGLDDADHRSSYTLIPSLPRIEYVRAMYHSSWFISTAGDLFACGLNSSQQLDLERSGTLPERILVPMKMVWDKPVRSITTAHAWVTIIVTKDEQIYRFGSNSEESGLLLDAKQYNSKIKYAVYGDDSAFRCFAVLEETQRLKKLTNKITAFQDLQFVLLH